MAKILTIQPLDVGGEKYLTVAQMAAMTNRSEQTIYHLILRGNSVRRMRCYRVAGRTLIPLTELTEFPFTFSGPAARHNVYHYNERGEPIFEVGQDKKV